MAVATRNSGNHPGSLAYNMSLGLIKILNDPFQRFGWDDEMLDFKLLETVECSDFVHHICYAAWSTPPAVTAADFEHEDVHIPRDACYCVSAWKNSIRRMGVMEPAGGLSLSGEATSSQTTFDEHLFEHCQVFTTFSIARPDVPPVPGRVRLDIEADDFLVMPNELVRIRKVCV